MRSYMNTEYTSLRNEINQYKTGQITLFTATASATGIMLGIFINLIKVGEFNLLNALLLMMPLIVIIPSSFMFFEKAVNINKLEAYCAVFTERFMRDTGNTENYLGYPKYKTEYIYQSSRPVKDKRKIIGDYVIKTDSILPTIKEYYTKWLIHKDTKHWVNFGYAYWGLTCTCFIVFVVYAFGSISNLFEGVLIAINNYTLYFISVLIFVALSSEISYGRTTQKDEIFWCPVIIDQIIVCAFFILMLGNRDVITNPYLLFAIGVLMTVFLIIMPRLRNSIGRIFERLGFQKYLSEEIAVSIYLLMFAIYVGCLLISLSNNTLSDRAFVSILCLVITATVIIWIFVNISSIILGNASYDTAYDIWDKCITSELPKKCPDVYPMSSNDDENAKQEES